MTAMHAYKGNNERFTLFPYLSWPQYKQHPNYTKGFETVAHCLGCWGWRPVIRALLASFLCSDCHP